MIDPLATLPGYALRRAANAMMTELGNRLSASGMRVLDTSVLMLIDSMPNVTASEIGRILEIQRANMVPLLNRLESVGLIDRKPLDRKSLAISLTPAGQRLLAKVSAIVMTFEQDLIERVPPEHRPHLLPALTALWRGTQGP